MKITLAQIKTPLGDIKNNLKKILQVLKTNSNSDLIVFCEGQLFGYPPSDLILKKHLLKKSLSLIASIKKHLPSQVKVLIGGFFEEKGQLYNGAFLLEKNKKDQVFKKEFLANQDVFNESRYFSKGSIKDNFFILGKKRVQILICEDLFHNPQFKSPDLIVSLNSSPFTLTKKRARFNVLKTLSKKYKAPSIYLNRVGGQGELIFDGASFITNPKGQLLFEAPSFKESIDTIDLTQIKAKGQNLSTTNLESTKQALILGLKDFVSQAGFEQVHLGLSGGMDSALVAYLACQALTPQQVKCFFIPSSYSSKLSLKIAKDLQKQLGFDLEIWKLDKTYKFYLKEMSFLGRLSKINKGNIQARLRALLLMTYSHHKRSLLLSTGNKSEVACGYSTLYGDLAGGVMPIGDLLKTEVYQLAQFINQQTPVFSKELLNRSPSAELYSGQKDTDELPPYSQLDPILKKLIKHQAPAGNLEKHFEQLIFNTQFKRAQSPPILKIKDQAFGQGWQMPVVQKFN